VFYLLLKAQGKSVKDHPVIDEFIRIRTLLEKLKPIDAKLKNQVDKLIKMATLGQVERKNREREREKTKRVRCIHSFIHSCFFFFFMIESGDPRSFKPRMDQMVNDSSSSATAIAGIETDETIPQKGSAGVYKPPKLQQTFMTESSSKNLFSLSLFMFVGVLLAPFSLFVVVALSASLNATVYFG
jgi:hypothetical protein